MNMLLHKCKRISSDWIQNHWSNPSIILNPFLFQSIPKRKLTCYPCRKQEDHKIEFMLGKHRKRKINPPAFPIHPNEEKPKNMNHFITFKDLKIRWRNTSKNYRKKITIARKWKNLHSVLPMNQPSCLFVLHKNLPFTRKNKKEKEEKRVPNTVVGPQDPKESTEDSKKIPTWRSRRRKKMRILEEMKMPMVEEEEKESSPFELPPKELHPLLKNTKDMFCIFKSNFINEHKVTIGDIVQTEKLHRRKAGDVVYFGTVLFVGSKDFSIIGKPTIPYCRVKGVIEQLTLSKETLSFRYKKVRRSSRFLRIRHWVTIIKIEDIIIDINNKKIQDERIKPLRILDLWANRWLYKRELNFIKYNEQTKRPLAENIYDLIEHQPNTLHRRGLTETYRFYPDPYAHDFSFT